MSHFLKNKALFIAKDVTVAATNPALLAEGEITILDQNGDIMVAGTTYADSPRFTIVEGTGVASEPFRWQQDVEGGLILRYAGLDAAAPVLQVSYIGYNTSTGAITVANSTEYSMILTFTWDKDVYSKRADRHVISYTSSTSATQQEIAEAFVAKINNNPHFNKQVIAATVNTGTTYGVRITALAVPFSRLAYKQDMITFDVSLVATSGFGVTTQLDINGFLYGTTTTGVSVRATKGSGYYLDLWYREIKMLGFEGHLNLTKHPVLLSWGNGRALSSVGSYDIYTIDHLSERILESSTTGTSNQHQASTIAVVPGSALQTRLEAILNPYMASIPRPQPAVSL